MPSFPLNKEQQEAVDHKGGPLLMAAGAGSGKTRALTSRLKALIEGGVRPEEIIAITFTNKAADQMRERVLGVGAPKPKGSELPTFGMPFIGTFHALGWRILKKELAYTGRRPGFSVLDADDALGLIKKICKAMDIPKERYKPIMISGAVSDLKGELKNPESLADSNDTFNNILREVYLRYESELLKNNAFDFDDLIEKVVRIFTKHPNVLNKYQTLFSHVLVDEYQDINTSQYRFVQLLAAKHQNISVVGDDAQAIYSFRGADFRNFLNFDRDWPNAKIIKLEQNYRSTKTIITAASALIQNNKIQRPKKLWTENEDGDPITLVGAEDPDTEGGWVVEEIRKIFQENPGASIGILYRTNAQSRPIEQALILENLPYKIFGGLKFYERKEIKDVVAGLKVAQNPDDTISGERLLKSLGIRTGNRVLEVMRGSSKNLGIIELINVFLRESGYAEFLADKFNNPQERLENIAELVKFASQFETLEAFLERVSLLASADIPSSTNSVSGIASRGKTEFDSKGRPSNTSSLQTTNYQLPTSPVTLMTIHIAKGLEFDNVFIVGVNEGLLPHEKSMTRVEEVEEERRLMYVAMTRARKKLYILFHTFPSRFLRELPNDLLEFISPTGMMHGLPDEDEMWLE
ncbi:MAG: UvrD-helicase domain-containing protein [bacterium]|nr:UvrD-helicase domain-containing protein [bacterium]